MNKKNIFSDEIFDYDNQKRRYEMTIKKLKPLLKKFERDLNILIYFSFTNCDVGFLDIFIRQFMDNEILLSNLNKGLNKELSNLNKNLSDLITFRDEWYKRCDANKNYFEQKFFSGDYEKHNQTINNLLKSCLEKTKSVDEITDCLNDCIGLNLNSQM